MTKHCETFHVMKHTLPGLNHSGTKGDILRLP
jgi:hypothetical protein